MYSKTWAARGDSWSVVWHPEPPYLEGTRDAVTRVQDHLRPLESIELNHLGDTAPANVEEAHVVLAALVAVYPGTFHVSESAPELIPPLPDNAVG